VYRLSDKGMDLDEFWPDYAHLIPCTSAALILYTHTPWGGVVVNPINKLAIDLRPPR
jgi:hypothetical protein